MNHGKKKRKKGFIDPKEKGEKRRDEEGARGMKDLGLVFQVWMSPTLSALMHSVTG